MDSQDFSITPTNDFNESAVDIKIDSPVNPSSDQLMAAPGLAPGQKPDPKAQKSIYGEIPQIPVLDAIEGIKFDFNHGIRILFPLKNKTYHVTFMDIDTGVILYSADTVPGAFVTSVKNFISSSGSSSMRKTMKSRFSSMTWI